MTLGSAFVPTLRPCGEEAWLLDLDDNRLVHRWAAAVRDAELPGVREVVPGLTTLLVTLDPEVTNAATLRTALQTLTPGTEQPEDREHHVIPRAGRGRGSRRRDGDRRRLRLHVCRSLRRERRLLG